MRAGKIPAATDANLANMATPDNANFVLMAVSLTDKKIWVKDSNGVVTKVATA